MKGFLIIAGFVITIILIAYSFRPVIINEDTVFEKIRVRCDSIYIDKNEDIVFVLKNMEDEHYYINRGKYRMMDYKYLKQKCESQVLKLEFLNHWSLFNMSNRAHPLVRISFNEKEIWSAMTITQR
jgi:hypothetical protein